MTLLNVCKITIIVDTFLCEHLFNLLECFLMFFSNYKFCPYCLLMVSEMIKDAHPFPCSNCKLVTPHTEMKRYNTEDVAEAPEEVWLVECQRCFLQRIIYPSDRVTSKEDDIIRCNECGGWKMKSGKCRVCRLAAGFDAS